MQFIGAGQICAVIANVNRDPKHRRQPWTAEDFFPFLAELRPETEPAADGGIDGLLSAAASMGATIVDQDGISLDEAPYAVRS